MYIVNKKTFLQVMPKFSEQFHEGIQHLQKIPALWGVNTDFHLSDSSLFDIHPHFIILHLHENKLCTGTCIGRTLKFCREIEIVTYMYSTCMHIHCTCTCTYMYVCQYFRKCYMKEDSSVLGTLTNIGAVSSDLSLSLFPSLPPSLPPFLSEL